MPRARRSERTERAQAGISHKIQTDGTVDARGCGSSKYRRRVLAVLWCRCPFSRRTPTPHLPNCNPPPAPLPVVSLSLLPPHTHAALALTFLELPRHVLVGWSCALHQLRSRKVQGYGGRQHCMRQLRHGALGADRSTSRRVRAGQAASSLYK